MNVETTDILQVDECWERLRAATIGRLALVVNGGPEIFPVNYLVDHSSLVIRTGDGTKVDALRADPRAAFEIDGFNPDDGTAFSVIIKGQAKEISNPDELRETVSLDVSPLQSGVKNHFIRIIAEEVTGRRFHVTEPSTWESSLSHAPRAPEE